MIILKYRSRIWLAQPIRNTIRNWSNDCNCLWANSKQGETVCKRGKTRDENNHAYSNFIRQIVFHVFLPVRSAKNQEELSVISCISLPILCYATACDFNELPWDMYATQWEIEMKGLIKWYGILLNKNISIHRRVLIISE